MTRSIMVLGLALIVCSAPTFAREYLTPETRITALKVSAFRKMGIEIQKQLQHGERISGENCSLSTVGSGKGRSPSNPGTGYVLVHHGVPAGSIDPIIQWSLTARNWFSSPHVIILRCNTPRDFSLTIGEIEKDLAGLIRFYKP